MTDLLLLIRVLGWILYGFTIGTVVDWIQYLKVKRQVKQIKQGKWSNE